MSIIKEQIKYLGKDMTINFNLGSNDDFLGYQEEIDNLTEFTSAELVNPDIDLEERKIKYASNIGPLTLTFQFHVTGNVFASTFYAAGFGTNDISGSTTNMQNSFFILDFYDTFDTYTQTKIFTTYLTKLIGNDAYGNRTYTPVYVINSGVTNQLYYWYVPISFLNAQTGTTVTGYTKFTFYNAISGKTAVFYNLDNINLTTAEQMYFKSVIDLTGMTWRIITPSFPNVIAQQLWTSPDYNQKVDDTITNFNNEAQNYPSGNSFNYLTGTYNTIS
jgi:hypothetical protein